MKYRFCDQYRRLFSNGPNVKRWRTDMLMLDRRTLLRAGSAAVGAAALAPSAPALARAPQAGKPASAGYAPVDIAMTLFTHCHFDHLWGISDGKNASLLFPSAEFVASETEVAFWSAPDLVGKVSAKQQPLVTQANLKLASPRLRLITPGAHSAPGLTTSDPP